MCFVEIMELLKIGNIKESIMVNQSYFSVVFGFFVIGFLFKLSSFPGHLWASDVYVGSPFPIVAFFILPAKVTIITIFMRIFLFVFPEMVSI